jgi:hypothetical protein
VEIGTSIFSFGAVRAAIAAESPSLLSLHSWNGIAGRPGKAEHCGHANDRESRAFGLRHCRQEAWENRLNVQHQATDSLNAGGCQ